MRFGLSIPMRSTLSFVIGLGSLAAVARAQEWTGKINGCDAYIPDLGKPVRAAMVNSLAFDDADWRAVAKKYNCLMIQIVLNHWECPANARKIVATLNQASRDFPNHPEIQCTCVTLFGWSQTSAGACRVATQPELANRVLAVVAIHEIDTQPWLPPLSVPHLFISGDPDGFSELLVNVEDANYSHDAAARNRATDQGAPLTMVNDVAHCHTDVYNNYAFTRVWLEEIFDQRLPATPPTDKPVVMPDWQNHPGWLGTYDVVKRTHTPPWGDGQRLTNVVIAPRSEYRDPRKHIWLPSRRCAEVWRIYSEKGIMPEYGTLSLPKLVPPTITVQPQDLTILKGQPFAFTAAVNGTPPITYQWWRVKGDARKLYSSMPNCFSPWDPTTDADYGATFYLVASNPAGSITSNKATLTLSTTGTAPPSILVQPRPATVRAGQSARFVVRAQGTPEPTFQWLKNGVDIPGATAAAYTTPPTTDADDGAAYSVLLRSSAGSITSMPALLSIEKVPAPASTTQPQTRIPVIYDSDFAGDFDDTYGLVMMLKNPRFDLKLVSTTGGMRELHAKLFARYLTAAQRTDVPIGLGAGDNRSDGAFAQWLKDDKLGNYPGKVYQDGVQALIDTINHSPQPVTIIANGPMETLGAALRKDPNIATKAHLVAMIGNLNVRDAAGHLLSEQNVKQDTRGSKLVLSARWNSIVITPLDTAIVFLEQRYQSFHLLQSTDPLLRVHWQAEDIFARYWHPKLASNFSPDGNPNFKPDGRRAGFEQCLFAAVTVYLADPTQDRRFVTIQKLPVKVTDDGTTVVAPEGTPIDVAIKWKNREAFLDYVASAMAGVTPSASLHRSLPPGSPD